MKISVKQYAQSLYEAVADKSNSQIKNAVKNFFQILVQNNDLAKADEIINEFVKIWNKENGIIEAGVESAKALDDNIVKLLNNYIAELSGAKTVILNQTVNKYILGGVIIKYGDKILDGSLRARLGELKSRMIQ
ncbi:MAG: ATP synthase F1 subunit delta [Candidatus Falkowbacteria bacterium]